jgi:hypothetical protein
VDCAARYRRLDPDHRESKRQHDAHVKLSNRDGSSRSATRNKLPTVLDLSRPLAVSDNGRRIYRRR